MPFGRYDQRIVDEERMPSKLDEIIRRNLLRSFPDYKPTFESTRSWHGSFPAYTAILEHKNDVHAHAGVVDRTVRVGTRQARVAGIQNVFVLPEARGKGLCGEVMRLAMREAAARGFDVGLLFCIPKLAATYAACGWLDAGERKVTRIDEGVECGLPDENICMYHPLRLASLPDGDIHLQGNDW